MLRAAASATLSFAVLLALAACPGDDDGDSSDSSADASPPPADAAPGLSAEELCTSLSETICAAFVACDCRFDVRPYDAAGCVAARTQACVDGFGARVAPDIAAGHAEFFADEVAACLADLGTAASACRISPSPSLLPPACDAIVGATAGIGETCMLTGGGLAYCAGAEGLCIPGESGPPTCVALPVAGKPCLADRCAAGLTCVAETCVAPGDAGADCDDDLDCTVGHVCNAAKCAMPGLVDAPCEETRDCKGDLACIDQKCAVGSMRGDECRGPDQCASGQACGRAPETRTCAARVAPGLPCEADACTAGHLCTGMPATCQALPGDGAACLDGFACADGLTCVDGMGVCGPLPGLGETCAVGQRFCQDGLGCDQMMNVCVGPGGLGDVCPINPPDYVCAEGLGCNFGEQSICVAQQGAGGDCTNDRECLPGTYCEFSELKCRAELPDGSACEDGNECLEGSECELGADGPKCRPIPGSGQPCVNACNAPELACQGPGGECAAQICVLP